MNSPLAFEAAHLVDRIDRLARSTEAAGELNPAQWEALRFVARANRFSRSPAALAEFLGSTRGTVSQSLIALEQKGYVTREPSAQDRRSVVLGLTARGERALKNDPIRQLAADLARGGTDKLEALVETLKDAVQAMVARNGGRAFGICHTCCHFRKDGGPGSRQPHYCSLLDAALSDADSHAICVEQEPA